MPMMSIAAAQSLSARPSTFNDSLRLDAAQQMVSGLRLVQPSVRGSRGRSPFRQTNSWRAAAPSFQPIAR